MRITVTKVGSPNVGITLNDGTTIRALFEQTEFQSEFPGAYEKHLNGTQVGDSGAVTMDTVLNDGDILALTPKNIKGGTVYVEVTVRR